MNKKTYQAPETVIVFLRHASHLLNGTNNVNGNTTLGWGGKGSGNNGGAEACSRGGGWDDDDTEY